MMTSTNKLIYFSILCSFASFPYSSHADALQAVPQHEKLIQARPTILLKDQDQFTIDFSTETDNYQVNQRIRFIVKSNQRFFLYLFNVSPTSGQALTLLPNRFQNSKQIQYEASNQSHTVPNSNLEFYADQEGTERIIMVASKKYLNVEHLKNYGQTKSAGDFYSMEKPFDALDKVINEAYQDQIGYEKLLQLRSHHRDNPSLPNGLIIKELRLNIHP